jgi:hypothetical protein
MNSHIHKHDHCQHARLRYCQQCNKPYCLDCGAEWNLYTTYSYYSNPIIYPTYTPTFTSSTSATTLGATSEGLGSSVGMCLHTD